MISKRLFQAFRAPSIFVSAASRPTLVGAKDNREKLLERALSRHQYSGDARIEVLDTAQELFGLLSRPLLNTIAHLDRADWLPPLSTMETYLPE